MSTTYWSTLVPYIQCDIDEQQFISGSSFNLNMKIWETYAVDGDRTVRVDALERGDQQVKYGIVYGNTNKQGTYPLLVSAHDDRSNPDDAGAVQYIAAMAQGDIDIPGYQNYEETGGTLELDDGFGSFDYFSSAEVNYQGERGLIEDNWSKYPAGDNEEYSTFSESLEGTLLNLGNRVYNLTNVGEPIFLFQKTKNEPINLNNLSYLSSSVDNIQETAGITTTQTTQVTTTTGTTVSSVSTSGY